MATADDRFFPNLSRREREFLHIVYELGEASATDVQERLPEETKNAATRKILSALLKKGAVQRRKVGKKYLYAPVEPPESAASSALSQILHVFYGGSLSKGLMGMMELGKDRFSDSELEYVRKMIDRGEPRRTGDD